jgi:60 kDa SS-A/Ro ribonucleoprotein
MNKYSQHFQTPNQREPVFGKTMVKNNAGGYVFEANKWSRFDRFLILGTESNTFYESSKKLTLDNAENAVVCIKEDGIRAVNRIVEVSDKALGIKNDPAIFALALASHFGNNETRKLAFESVSKVCRIGTHIMQFAEIRQAIGGGWGRSMREAIAKWYDRDISNLIFQVLKYRQREGWTHRDLLRLSHPKTPPGLRAKVLNAICRPDKWDELKDESEIIEVYLKLRDAGSSREVMSIINSSKVSVPREFVPTEFLKAPEVWAALLNTMPMTAMLRNLGNMSKVGLLKPLTPEAKFVANRLTNEIELKSARIHPFSILIASKVYSSGKGIKGDGTWDAVPQIKNALDEAFELCFGNVKPTGKSYLIGIDISGSMSFESAKMQGCIYPSEAAAAMALITARTEANHYIGGFSTKFIDLGINSKDSLPTVLQKTMNKAFGGTDTSVMIQWALNNKIKADALLIYSDGETWAGSSHTFMTMQKYRNETGLHRAKLGIANFTTNRTSLIESNDDLSMDFVGLSADLPQAINVFINE